MVAAQGLLEPGDFGISGLGTRVCGLGSAAFARRLVLDIGAGGFPEIKLDCGIAPKSL